MSVSISVVGDEPDVAELFRQRDNERRQRAAETGAWDFLAKPVDFDTLKEQRRRLPTMLLG